MEELTLISVVGMVTSDGAIHLRPSFPVPADGELTRGQRPILDDEDESVILTEYAADGQLLYRYPLPTFIVCNYPRHGAKSDEGGPGVRCFADVVPLSNECTRLRITGSPGCELELERKRVAPVIRFDGSAPEIRDGCLYIRWSVDPETASVLATWVNDAGRQPLGVFSGSGSFNVNLAYVEGRSGVVILTVSADLNFASIESEPLLTGHESIQPLIVLPLDDCELERSVVEFFAWVPPGQVFEGAGVERLEWFSSVDGVLGRGQYLIAALSVGSHRIVLRQLSTEPGGVTKISEIGLRVSGDRVKEAHSPSGSSC